MAAPRPAFSSRPPRITVAPSGFKESMDADATARAIAEGVLRVLPDAQLRTVPLVDGGEGSASALARATGGSLVPVVATGPLGTPVSSHFALLGPSGAPVRTAVVEMAAVAGLRLVPPGHRDPGGTTTRGVGELVRAALDSGARRILVGCGDSGTSDGGAGALRALGLRLLDADGHELPDGGAALARLDRVDASGLDPRLHPAADRPVELLVACNPHNVLCGERGVARVFGPQKGATPKRVEELSAALAHWAHVLRRDLRAAFGEHAPSVLATPGLLETTPGGGASGGLGAGLAAIGGRLLPRFEVMFDHVDLDDALAHADLVITAEGAIDAQTPHGKIPAEVARRAKSHGKPVIALAGTIGPGAGQAHGAGIDAIAGILPVPVALPEALHRGAEFLTDATERTLRLLLVGAALVPRVAMADRPGGHAHTEAG
ncbi:glycerate kinase family protein [Allostreptomyces psammosilenae]|nr:glycerate kinase [Allostreptomyces psammosilenae]